MASVTSNLTTFSDVARSGSLFSSTWGTTANAASSNNLYASHGHSASIPADGYSGWLQGVNLVSAVPSGATIDGIEVHVERRNNGGLGTVKDSSLRLVKGGTIQGNDKADLVANWPSTDGSVTYGGASDLWGLTFTDANVNAADFGVVISMVQDEEFEQSPIPQIDHVSMTIHYTEASSGSVEQMMMMGVT